MVEKTRFQRWKEVQETRTRRQHLSKSEQKQLKNLKGWTAKDDRIRSFKEWQRFNRHRRR